MLKFLTILLFLFIASTAQAASFTATVDRNSLARGENLTLTLELSDAKAKSEPAISELTQNFTILGQQQGSSTTIINGDYSSSKSWAYTLAPKKEGSIIIPAIAIETKDGNLKTSPITLEVGKASSLPAKAADDKVSISAEVSKTAPYQNEPIILTVQMMAKSSFSNVNLSQVEAENAIIQPQGEPKIIDKVINGIPLKAIEEKYIITPLKAGKITIPPVIMSGNIAVARKSLNDPFMTLHGLGGMNMFAFDNYEPFTIASNEITLDVKAPAAAMDPWLPANSVNITENFNTQNAKAGEPLTRKITITAEGSAGSQLSAIESLPASNDFKIYADKPVITDEVKSGEIIGKREEAFTIIPQKSGEITLPEINIPWWDVKNNKVAYAHLDACTIKVAAGSLPEAAPAKEDATPAPVAQEVPAKNNIVLYSILAGLFTVLLLVVLWAVKLQRKLKNIKNGAPAATAKEQQQATLSNKDLASVKTPVELSKFIQTYASVNWGTPQNSPIETIFSSRSLGGENAANLISELNAALYAGRDIDLEKLKQQYNEIIIAAQAKIKKPKKGEELELNPS
jgi:hypothetical protein